MKKLIALIVLTASATAFAGTAYLKYERVTGMTKQCVYDYLGNEYTKTIRSSELCPLSIKV
jgi:predicted ABC-type sugar transport system permease subunit